MEGFVETAAGPVPRVAAGLSLRDRFGTLRARLGIARNRYRVNPGLYCVGNPTPESPVLVTANYKLSFDSLRSRLSGLNAFILVADTRGINVWCAAGKGTFSADEIALQITRTRLAERVSHRGLVLPQLAAPGVAAHELAKKSGFSARFGPIRSSDIKEFLVSGMKCGEAIRSITFTLAERAVLVPVEIALALKPLFFVIAGLFLLAGIGPDFFNLGRAAGRGWAAALVTIAGFLTGAGLVPLLLPWIPARQFWLKGIWCGLVTAGSIRTFAIHQGLTGWGLFLWTIAVSSYMAMNFTGATPFTSLSGVKKELSRGLAVQICLAAAGLALFLGAPFF